MTIVRNAAGLEAWLPADGLRMATGMLAGSPLVLAAVAAPLFAGDLAWLVSGGALVAAAVAVGWGAAGYGWRIVARDRRQLLASTLPAGRGAPTIVPLDGVDAVKVLGEGVRDPRYAVWLSYRGARPAVRLPIFGSRAELEAVAAGLREHLGAR